MKFKVTYQGWAKPLSIKQRAKLDREVRRGMAKNKRKYGTEFPRFDQVYPGFYETLSEKFPWIIRMGDPLSLRQNAKLNSYN
jgi:hypothetical protein